MRPSLVIPLRGTPPLSPPWGRIHGSYGFIPSGGVPGSHFQRHIVPGDVSNGTAGPLEMSVLVCHALSHHTTSVQLRWISPNSASRLEYHTYCLPNVFPQTNPVKYILQDIKLPLKSYRLHGREESIVSIELY